MTHLDTDRTPHPSLRDLMNSTLQDFRSRRFDPYGKNPHYVHNAAWDVISNTGLTPTEILQLVSQQTTLDEDSQKVIKAQIPEDTDPNLVDLIHAGNILMEELRRAHPELIAEERARDIS